MERSQKKNSIMDIYMQSLKKDASFYKDKMEQQANELKEMRLQLSQEKQKQKEEMDSLKEELGQMVREVSKVKSENMSLLEQLEEYESTYVPGSGSKKLKDALGEARRELRETMRPRRSRKERATRRVPFARRTMTYEVIWSVPDRCTSRLRRSWRTTAATWPP